MTLEEKEIQQFDKYCQELIAENRKLKAILAEFEDMLENGRLVELPILYQLSVGCKGSSFENYYIDEVHAVLAKSGDIWNLKYKDRLCNSPHARELVGYFDTKEQAEAKLKELQESGI